MLNITNEFRKGSERHGSSSFAEHKYIKLLRDDELVGEEPFSMYKGKEDF